MKRSNIYILIGLINILLCLPAVRAEVTGEKPVIFNYSEGAIPGEVIGIQGANFNESSELWYAAVTGKEETLKPEHPLEVVSRSDNYIAAVLPDEKVLTGGTLIAVWVKNEADQSNPVFINQARVMTVEFEEIMPGTVFRLFGRNLFYPGQRPKVLFRDTESGQTVAGEVINSQIHIVQVKAPQTLIPRKKYNLITTNGTGGKWGESVADEFIAVRSPATDPFHLGTPWGGDFVFYSNIYNVKDGNRLSVKARGDGIHNDREAIQQAIDIAHAGGGGVVYLPEGIYRIEFTKGCGLTMRSNVVIKGDGQNKTEIRYGYGFPQPFIDPIGKGGWPDETVDGVVVLWPLHTTLSGLCDLSLTNVNASGLWRHSLKSMPPDRNSQGAAGSGFFAVNCRFNMDMAWGLSWSCIDKVVIADCDFNSVAQVTWPWLLHCDGITNYVLKNNRIRYAAGRFGFNDSHNGIIENNRFTRYGDLQTFKGETGGLNIDYAKDIVILQNVLDVEGRSLEERNLNETILSQGGNPINQSLGVVTSASDHALTDTSFDFTSINRNTGNVKGDVNQRFSTFVDAVAIIDGKGAGQWRYITGHSGNKLETDRPWLMNPGKGSRYALIKWSAEDWLVKDNVLVDQSRGLWFYCGGHDVVIEGNQFINSEGIYLRADQRMEFGRYNLTWNFQIENNKIIRTDDKSPAYICSALAIQRNHALLGTGVLGIEIRRNLVQARKENISRFMNGEGYWAGVHSLTPDSLGDKVGILGTIFENNIAVDCDYGYRVKHSYQTVIHHPSSTNVTHSTDKEQATGSSRQGLVLIENNKQQPADPFASLLAEEPEVIKKKTHLRKKEHVRIDEILFESYRYSGTQERINIQIPATLVSPDKQGNYPAILLLQDEDEPVDMENAIKWTSQGFVTMTMNVSGLLQNGACFSINPDLRSTGAFCLVLAALRGLKLLGTQPGVDKDRIGLSGKGWGGYQALMVSALANPLIKATFVESASGCFDYGSILEKDLNKMEAGDRAIWLQQLDAGRRMPAVQTPLFMSVPVDDSRFYPTAVTLTLQKAKGPKYRYMPIHEAEEKGNSPFSINEETRRTFFNQYLKGDDNKIPGLKNVQCRKLDNGSIEVSFLTDVTTGSARLSYSPVGGLWPDRKWEIFAIPTVVKGENKVVLPVKYAMPFELFVTLTVPGNASVSSDLIWCN